MQNLHDYENHEKEFYKALKNYCYVGPKTDTELEHLIETVSKMKFELPELLNNPLIILQRGEFKKTVVKNMCINNEIYANLARAAREGNDITINVSDVMKADRESAEKMEDV